MIEVEWKCQCQTAPQKLSVRARQDGEDIADFMKFLQKMLGHAHREISPLCQSGIMEYVKLPVVDGKGIGET